jgi:GTP:adenosylcobinamide-phosphate guanylyltransferase
LNAVAASDAVHALVLAGARASGDPLCLAYGVESKALIDIVGEPMLARVLRALTQSGLLSGAPIVTGLTQAALQKARGQTDVVLAPAAVGGPAASVLGALKGGAQLPLLVTTCDHALLTPEMIRHFVGQAISGGADLSIGFATKETIQARYPETRRTYLPFGGAPLSGCNLFLIASPEALKVIRFWRQAEQDRKKPWKVALRFGPLTALRLLIGKPSAARAFAILSGRFGVRIAPILMPFADAAVDVDTEADLALVRRVLAARAQV